MLIDVAPRRLGFSRPAMAFARGCRPDGGKPSEKLVETEASMGRHDACRGGGKAGNLKARSNERE